MAKDLLRRQVISHVKELIDNNQEVSISKISKEYKVAWNTCDRWISDSGLEIPNELKFAKGETKKVTSKHQGFSIVKRDALDEKSKKDIKPENIIIKEVVQGVQPPTIYNYSAASSCVSATLIANRHDMGYDSNRPSIFSGTLSADKIHNYDYLYETSKKFITTNVTSKGYTKLKVYTTGLVQANAAVIKAAIDSKIALSFMNYDNSVNQYKEQAIILSEDGSTDDNTLLWLYANNKKDYDIKLVNHNAEYFRNVKTIYSVRIEDVQNPSIRKPLMIFVCANIEDMFQIYQREVQKYLCCKELVIRVLAEEIVFGTTNSEYRYGHNFGSFQNNQG